MLRKGSERPRAGGSAAGVSRREFIKGAAAGGALFIMGPRIWVPRPIAAFEGGWNNHPAIRGTRVVGVDDPKMTTEVKERATWLQQEPLVAAERVAANIDRMALALAEEKEVKKAWEKILVKPHQKAFNEVVVALKTNHIAKQRTRSAVVGKVCHVLTDVLGVKGENIFIYDACTGASMSTKTRFAGLPEGVHLADQWGGSNAPTAVPGPWKDGREKAKCLEHLVKGTVDILINIALCKGHEAQFGSFTMTMKNHFGTFEPGPSHRPGGGADYLLAINKTPEIVGPMDPKTGKVLFPRQQLCLVDALWASRSGPDGESTAQPNSLFMGVLGPVVDVQVARRFRRDRMGWPINEEVAKRFLAEFGLAETDLPGDAKIIDALA